MTTIYEAYVHGWNPLNLRREAWEHKLRMLAAERDFPNIDHRGTEPAIIREYQELGPKFLAAIERDFNRKS